METEISLKNISVVKCAVLTSLNPELKREILRVPGSIYDKRCRLKYQYHRKKLWNIIVHNKAKDILNRQQLPESLQEKVISILKAIAFRMLTWAEYHEVTLGLTRYYSLNFLSYSHFNSQGLIDNKKAAEEMINDVNLSIKQKYKLACIYCFKNHIFTFYKEMVDKKIPTFDPDSKEMEKPEIVKYWTFNMMDRVDECSKYTPHYIYRLEKSIKSGSKEAVKYSLAMTDQRYQESALIYGVTEVLKHISRQSDWIVFRDQRFDDSKESWVPNYFYIDILCFILSNMTDDQRTEALEKNIKGRETNTNANNTTVLEMFLCWPYQNYFMKTAVLLWDLMPRKTYVDILYKICETIEPRETRNLQYGEEKIYDYKKILKEFWIKSPGHFKSYLFINNKHVDYWDGVEVTTKPPAIDLILRLVSMRTFSYDDEEIISIILCSATVGEKAILTSGLWWVNYSCNVLEKLGWRVFDRLLLILFDSEEETREFENKLNLLKVVPKVCCRLLKYNKINGVKDLIDWTSLSTWKLLSMKSDIIYSHEGVQYCRKLLLSRKYRDFEECIKWFLESVEEEIEYKRWLTLRLNETSHEDHFPAHRFDKEETFDFITRFTKSKLPNLEAIKGIQTSVGDIFGRTFCEDLIAGSSFRVIYMEISTLVRVKTEFTGGQWERVDEFLRWSFSTEKEILEFKKTIFEVSGVDIHFQLIKEKRWEHAKRFFDWLGLSANEIKDLKKRTILYGQGWKMFSCMVFANRDMNNKESINRFLRWNLTDKATVMEFRDAFVKAHEGGHYFSLYTLDRFNELIESYLDELDQGLKDFLPIPRNRKKRCRTRYSTFSKRKSTVISPQKKIRLSPSVQEELHDENTDNCSSRKSQRLLNRANKI